MIHLLDQCGRLIMRSSAPKRIISLVPSLTELLVDLGLVDNLVGITKFCVHPEGLLTSKTIVGGTKTAHISKIKALKPDFILANKEENTPELVAELEKFCTVYVSDIVTLDHNLKLIADLGLLLGCETKSQQVLADLQEAANDFRHFVRDYPRQTAAYFIWKKPYRVAGGNTFINHLLECCNFKNIFSNTDRYPEVDVETNFGMPDIIFLSSEPFPFKDVDAQELSKLYPSSKVILVDGELFSWYGTRPLVAFPYFKMLRAQLA